MNEIIINNPGSELIQSVQTALLDDTDPDTNFSFYTFNDVPVPRVTKILDKVINKPGLLYWAANIGRKNMYIEQKKAVTIGTKVHLLIENFLKGINKYPDMSDVHPADIKTIKTSYTNFVDWITNLVETGNTFELIATELKVVCPLYGGTIDCIARINGANYIIDWKTSKSINTEYYIQAAAYMWAINNGYCKEVDHIDGIGIVRLPKNAYGYEESFLTYNNPVHAKYIDDYIRAFGSLLQAYYNLVHIEQFEHHYSIQQLLEE